MAGQRSMALWTAIGGVCAVVSAVVAVVQFAQAGDSPDPPVRTTAAAAPGGPSGSAPGVTAGPAAMLDLGLAPNFGEQSAVTGFASEALGFPVTSGGVVDVSYLDESECDGFASAAADLRFNWEGGGGMLRFFFVADDVAGDTTLVINGPDTSWYCNDDSFGTRNPTVELAAAPSGRYDIWVASYAAGDRISGTLYVTELLSIGPA